MGVCGACKILGGNDVSLCCVLIYCLSNLKVLLCQGESECPFPEDLRSRGRTYMVFGAHFGAERGYKTMGIQCPIVSNNRYQYSLVHTGAQNCCAPKCLAQSSKEIHPGWPSSSRK